MSLAIFDLDNTLIGGDSDVLWGQYLVDNHLVDGEVYERENLRFYEDYKLGKLDIYAFLEFSLKPLAQYPLDQLVRWREDFLDARIGPIMLPKAAELVEKHRRQGDVLLIITATNRFVTEPIAARLGIENLLATEPEMVNGEYTGNVIGTPCFQDGKVKRLEEWLEGTDLEMGDSWFYSDSHNDLPLLQRVVNPVAVDADPILTAHALEHGWTRLSLR